MLPGTQVGAYRVLQQIGEGGMGSVWLAEHTMLGRRAAIKLLHPMFTTRPDIVMRFFNEARAATAISDPGIVQIFDFGTHSDGSAFIAMEMLEGEPLDRRLKRVGRLPIADALRILRQVANTLGVAHQRGIVHRDLKPENIFLVRDPEVIGGERAKVLDFGIAKLIGDQGPHTSTSQVMGTPAYMSPEQCRGAGHVDQRSDVYSLGCVLFALVTGGPPFQAEGSGDVIAMHLRERPPAPSARMRGIPRELDVLVVRCLAKEPSQRPASGTELAAEIGRLLGAASHVSVPSSSGIIAGSSAPAAVTTLTGASGTTLPHVARRSRVWWAAAAGLVAAGGVIAVIASRAGSSGTSAAPTAAAAAPFEPDAPNGPEQPVAAPKQRVAAPKQPVAAPRPPVAAPRPPVAESVAVGSEPRPAVPPPPPGPPLPPPGPEAALAGAMKAVLTRFVAWSKDHAGAPCPSSSVFGSAVNDPWGDPLQITCTDQPSHHIIGVVSAGPDRRPGTADDIGSWQLGRDVTDLVHGARWPAAAATPPKQNRPPRSRRQEDDIPRVR
jgi:hypothetical protein